MRGEVACAQKSLGIPVDGRNPTPADMKNLPGLLELQLRIFISTGAGFLPSGV